MNHLKFECLFEMFLIIQNESKLIFDIKVTLLRFLADNCPNFIKENVASFFEYSSITNSNWNVFDLFEFLVSILCHENSELVFISKKTNFVELKLRIGY